MLKNMVNLRQGASGGPVDTWLAWHGEQLKPKGNTRGGSPHVHCGQAVTKEMALQVHPGSFSRFCVLAKTLLLRS